MMEFRGLIASASKNENAGKLKSGFYSSIVFTVCLHCFYCSHCVAGFVTPQSKNTLPRKTLFTDKPKLALGDLKNNFMNVATPIKNGATEKVKEQQGTFLPSTPLIKSPCAFNEAIGTLNEATTNSTPNRNPLADYMDEIDIWNQKQLLSDEQFDLLFMIPPVMIPPSPPRSPSPIPITPKSPEYCWDFDDSAVSVWDREFKVADDEDEDELGPVNHSLLYDDNLDSECSH